MIGDKVKKFRMEKGLSLTELAERAGVAKSYLSSIERNIQSNPSIQFLEKIASVLNIPIESLINETEHSDIEETELDDEWKSLIHEAIESGISKEQFREFLEFNRWRMQNVKQNK